MVKGTEENSDTDETEEEEEGFFWAPSQHEQEPSCDNDKHAALPECVILPDCYDDDAISVGSSDPDHVTVSIERQPRSVDRGERMVMTVSNSRSRSRTRDNNNVQATPPQTTTKTFKITSPLALMRRLPSIHDAAQSENGSGSNSENAKETTPLPLGATQRLHLTTTDMSTIPEVVNKRNIKTWRNEAPLSVTFALDDVNGGDVHHDNSGVCQQQRDNNWGGGCHSEPLALTVEPVVAGEVLCSEDALLLTVENLKGRTERMEEDRQFLLLKIEQLQLRVMELETTLEEERAAARRTPLLLPLLHNSLRDLYASSRQRGHSQTVHTATTAGGDGHHDDNHTTSR